MATTKQIGFAAPYASKTFNNKDNTLVGRSGVVSGGVVTTSGGIASIQPVTFVQNGLFVSTDYVASIAVPPTITAPYFICLSTSSSVNVPAEVLTPFFVKRPEDVSLNTVLIAEWDGLEWRPLPYLDIDSLQHQDRARSIAQSLSGIASGFDATYSAGTVSIQAGSLIDRQGYLISKSVTTPFTAIAADVDGLNRTDQIIYRRPDDSSSRVGVVKYVVGQTSDPSDSVIVSHNTQIGNTAYVNGASKLLNNPSSNTSYFFYLQDYGARAQLIFLTSPDNMSTTTSPVVIASNVGDFDAILNPDGSIDVVYTRGNSAYYQRVTTAGASVYSEHLIATAGNPLSQIRLAYVGVSGNYFLHVIFKQIQSGSVSILNYVRLSAANTIETPIQTLVDLTALVTNPSIAKDDDDYLFMVAFENATTGILYLRTYDAQTATAVAAPSQLNSPVALGGDTYRLSTQTVLAATGGTLPRVVRTDNKDTLVFWLHPKGSGKFGVAVYSPRFQAAFGHQAVLQDLTGSSENIQAFAGSVDGMSTAHFGLRVGGNIVKASLRIDTAAALGVSGIVAAQDPTDLNVIFNAKGSLVHAWSVAGAGTTNNGTAITAQFFGPGLFGSQSIAAGEVVFLDSDYSGLPRPPTVGDSVSISGSGAGNNGTFAFQSVRSITVSLINYKVVLTSATFNNESSGPSGQFLVQAGNGTYFAKTTAGISNNMRSAYLTPTDVLITQYDSVSNALAVASSAIEEIQSFKRLYEFNNCFAGSSGQLSWNKVALNKAALSAPMSINFFNRKSTYTIAAFPLGITIGLNQVAYVVIPDDDVAQSLTIQVQSFGSGILDRHGRNAFPLFWNIGGKLYLNFAPYELESAGETVNFGSQISAELIAYLTDQSSPVPDPTNHNYTSTTIIAQTDNHDAALGKLDAAAGAAALSSTQDKTLKLVRGGTWAWNNGTGMLSWSAAADIQIAGVAENRNNIPAGSVSLPSDGSTAYVEINRSGIGPTNLTISVALISAIVPDANTYIIARRIGNTVLVGAQSMLLNDGESKELDAGLSQQNRTLIGGTVTPITEVTSDPQWMTRGSPLRNLLSTDSALDASANLDNELDKFFGQFRMAIVPTNTSRVYIYGSDRTMRDGTILSQQTDSNLIKQPDIILDFSNGNIYDSGGITVIGTFTLTSIPVGQVLWYAIGLNSTGIDVDNRATVAPQVTPASATGATNFPQVVGSIKLGSVLVSNPAGTPLVTQVRQLGVGSGSGGGTDPIFVQESIGTGDNVTTTFNLSAKPKNVASVAITVNRLIRVNGTEFTVNVAGKTVTFQPSYIPAPAQDIYAFYIAESPSPLAFLQETPSGISNGTNPNFLISNLPANKAATFVYVNRALVPGIGWNLIQGMTTATVQFLTGYIPNPGQDIYVVYAVNASAVGGGGGGGGGGGLPHIVGSMGSPYIIDPTLGIAPTTDALQIWFVRSQTGLQNITANPKIAPGMNVGQKLQLIGVDDTNHPVFSDSNNSAVSGISQEGDIDLVMDRSIIYTWNGIYWNEDNRRR